MDKQDREERTWSEELTVAGYELFDTVKKLVKEVDVRKVVVRKPNGSTLFEVPLAVGIVPVLLPQLWGAVILGAGIAWFVDYKIEIVRKADPVMEDVVILDDDTAASAEDVADVWKEALKEVDNGGVSAEEEVLIVEVEDLAPEPVEPDDLTAIKGIGPKLAQVLNEAGITTFAGMAAMNTDAIQAIISESGVRAPTNIEAWIEQAQILSS
jgi:predicted flap endonuclease-1-like 5' DNA nuclease